MTEDNATLYRTSLFEIPLWTAQLDEVLPYHTEMVREVESLIDSQSDTDNPPRYLAHQTASDPFELPSKGWRLLERLSNEAYSSLSKENFQRWRSGEFHLRRWAIRFGKLSDIDKARLARDSVHNHLPALFSSIYYLSVPPEFVENPDGGTLFLNPIGNLMDIMAPRTKILTPKEGRLLIFPAFVDHTPVPIRWDSSEAPRIVVSSDVFYVSGEARQGSSSPVIKAEADRV
jgi:hypothetical protein